MKIPGRILIILAVFVLVMGITYGVVNARNSSGQETPSRLEPGNGRFTPPDGAGPEFPGGGRNEFHGERGGGWLFGAIKNIAVIGIIVALIVLPKSWMQKRRRTTQIAAE
jgi:hypothetical protein